MTAPVISHCPGDTPRYVGARARNTVHRWECRTCHEQFAGPSPDVLLDALERACGILVASEKYAPALQDFLAGYFRTPSDSAARLVLEDRLALERGAVARIRERFRTVSWPRET